jgi:hypothetical protein
MVTGTLSQTGGEVRLDAIWRATDDSLTVLARVNVRAPAGDLNALTDSLTWRLLRQAWRRGTAPSPYLSAATTRSMPALRAFLEAERLWADGDILRSDSFYRQAFELDSTFYLAAFRYRAVRIWTAQTPDRAISARLAAHLAELPERERQLALVDSAPTTLGRFERLEAIVARWPDYAPGWMMLGDGIMHGIAVDLPDPAQSVRGIERWSELAPGDLTALGHLQWAASIADDAALARAATARLDSVMTARGVSGIFPRIASRTYHLLYGGSPPTGVGADVIPDFGGGVNAYAPPLARNPAAAESLSRAITTAPLPVALMPPRTDTTALRRFAFMKFGDFSAPTVTSVFAPSRFNPIIGEDPMFAPRTQFLMRLSGLSDATPTALSTTPATTDARRLSRSNRIEIEFMRGALAARARDSAGAMAVIRLLSTDTTLAARASVRSLRALVKGYASPSQQLSAADTLLAVQLDLSRLRRTGISLLGATAVAASPWFAASGRYGAVDTLTRIVKVYAGSPPTVALQLGTTPVLLLERAKALAALGRREEAWVAAKALAVGYPLASAALQPLVAQGKALAAELEQSADRSPRVPVPTAKR